MYNPVATYRIQFHKEFRLRDLKRIIPYLADLGVGTIYSSPIFSAVPGSMHGYDGTDPNIVNPEIGSWEEWEECIQLLHQYQIGWIQDIVPNHMAYHTTNLWLMDVLEKGRHSDYAEFFDITTDFDRDPLMVPFLQEPLEVIVENGGLRVIRKDLRCVLHVDGMEWPLRLDAYPYLLAGNSEAEEWSRAVTNDRQMANHDRHWQLLGALLQRDSVREWLDKRLNEISLDPAAMMHLANTQFYRLCHWQVTNQRINYRRFFTVNGLISLRMDRPEVFATYHRKVLDFISKGYINGIRVDHVDGLLDPNEYLYRLRMAAGADSYIVVEKILEQEERLPRNWPVQGTTGYDFMAMVNQLLINPTAAPAFTKFYNSINAAAGGVNRQLRYQKSKVLYHNMKGELSQLYSEVVQLPSFQKYNTPQVLETISEAIAQILIYSPVYRYYPDAIPLKQEDAAALKQLLNRIKTERPWLTEAVVFFEKIWFESSGDPKEDLTALRFCKRLMQYSGPLMAKAMEDTLMYTHNLFLGHNDVGDSIQQFGITVGKFHERMIERAEQWPLTMNATATHDTKRGEDARARLQVLTDLAELWLPLSAACLEWDRSYTAPDYNEKYLLLQTMVAVEPSSGDMASYRGRLHEYAIKALREGGVHTDWEKSSTGYEAAACAFIDRMLDLPEVLQKRWNSFMEQLRDAALVNGLIQLLLKCTCPGVPDIYQGTELEDLSLVDPDNRRAVDFGLRQAMLERINSSENTGTERIAELWTQRGDGSLKLWLMQSLLNERKSNSLVFSDGAYIPVEATGRHADKILAFFRRYDQVWYLVAVGLHTADEKGKDFDWRDTGLIIPPEAPEQFRMIWDNQSIKHEGRILIKDLFELLPIAILRFEQQRNSRKAGVLLPVFSLPSDFGIGDFGRHARSFVDFLSRSKQSIWQILPLTPVEEEAGFSPYSSISAMAGNPLFICPERLAEEGLLSGNDLDRFRIPLAAQVDYKAASVFKSEMLNLAFRNFKEHPNRYAALAADFEAYKESEVYWLQDFALFVNLRSHFQSPWNEWPEAFKHRDPSALELFARENAEAVDEIAWQQFLFEKQWLEIRQYCRQRSIEIWGDLPFYLNHDAVDVWVHPNLFSLDEAGSPNFVAGVPPDYFSADGQLWGMPTFNWELMKEDDYQWWIERLKRNLKLYDTVRLDHFRAFEAYWEIPADAITAKVGQWRKGPGMEFFEQVRTTLGNLPFVAEDLGDSMQDVYKLRDRLGIPGMRVLQFAFGPSSAASVDIPHNYTPNSVVYTGTHDNNTTKGWYQLESTNEDKARIQKYTGKRVQASNIHEVLIRQAYASVAETVIIPVQDILGLDSSARMNAPGTTEGNWLWRLQPKMLTGRERVWLRELVDLFYR